MQLLNKAAMLFFLYLTAAFTSQKEIPDATITSSELIRTSKKRSSRSIVSTRYSSIGNFYWVVKYIECTHRQYANLAR